MYDSSENSPAPKRPLYSREVRPNTAEAQAVAVDLPEGELEQLFEQLPFSIQLLDSSGRTLRINAAWRALWNIPEEVIQNHILRDYSVLEDPQLREKGITSYFERALQGEASRIPAIQYDPAELSLGGRPRWVEAYVHPLMGADGRVRQMVLIHEDVTARREAQALIERKTAEFATVFEHLPDPVVMATVDRNVALINPAASKLLGYSPDEIIGRSVCTLYASQALYERQGQERHNAQSTQIGPATYEMAFRHKNGDILVTETTSSVVRTADGTVLGYVGILRDIRERRRDEEMMKFISDAGDVLASSLDYKETLSTLAQLAVPTLGDWCIMDLLEQDGSVRRAEVVSSSPAHETLKADLLRFVPQHTLLDDPTARALFLSKPLLIPLIQHADVEAHAQSAEHAAVLRGTGVHSMLCVPLVARGRTLGVLTLLLESQRPRYTEKDLAYAKQLASKAAQAVANAELYRKAMEAVATRDEFLGTCSHELKTPITTMKLQLQRASQQLRTEPLKDALPEGFLRRFDVTSRQLGRLEKLIEDMLDVSRIVSGRLTMEFEPLCLAALVREAVDEMADQFSTGGTLAAFETDQPAIVRADRLRLLQILDNLLSNALKYGAGKPVGVQLLRSRQDVRVMVSDQGPGISQEDLPRIFERFERAALTKYVGGLGLGLYISRQLAEAHGGRIEVASVLGQGATFTLILPALDGHPPAS